MMALPEKPIAPSMPMAKPRPMGECAAPVSLLGNFNGGKPAL